MHTVPLRAVIVVAFLIPGAPVRADDWPQWRGPTRDGVWKETGVVEKFAGPKTEPLWRVPISSGYSGPTVADGRVFVTDRVVEPKQIERVHCFDARTGKQLWSHEYDCAYRGVGYEAGPRASVTIDSGRAYSLGTMGDLICFDAADGKVLWEHDLDAEYPIEMPTWGLAAAPLVEGELLIVQVGAGGGACLVAFDKTSGKEVWKAVDDTASYSAPIVIEQAGKRVLVCWTANGVVGVNPKTGEVYWRHAWKPKRVAMYIASPVFDGQRIFLSSFFDGSLMLTAARDKPAVEPLWLRVGPSEKETDSLQSIISTPLLIGDYIYGVDSYGELRCLDAKTGDRIWEDRTAVPRERWATIHFVRNGDKIWMFNDRGELLISRLSPRGFEEISRTRIIEPTTNQLPRGDGVCWSHPAFANRCVYQRNDKELICVDLAAR